MTESAQIDLFETSLWPQRLLCYGIHETNKHSIDNINRNSQNTCATIASVWVPKTNASKLEGLESQTQEHKEQIVQEEDDKASVKDNEIINGEIMGGTLSQISSLFSRSNSSMSGVSSERSTQETSMSSQLSYSSVTPDGNTDYHVPIVGYEVMEERAHFTLRTLFPDLRLKLPPKRWFGDNFETSFLENRLIGLQTFINNILVQQELTKSKPVQDFFCLDDPPGPDETLEESRAVCESLEESVYLLTQKLKDRESEIKLLEEEVRVLQSQQEMLLKSLKLECSLTMQSLGLCPQMLGPLTSSPKTRNYTPENPSSFHLVSAHLLRLHRLNMTLVNMLEKSKKYWFQESLQTINQNDTLIEIAARLSERSSNYLDTREPFFESPLCPRAVSKSPPFEDIPERYGGDGCTEPEERLSPLGGIENPHILPEGDKVETFSRRCEASKCEMFPVVSQERSLDEPLKESKKTFEHVPSNDTCQVLNVCTHPSEDFLTKTDFSSQSEVI
ncbi:uncharacterized protein LOC143239455 isoform X2 [Tachypleus tridentatus]|uniref:uncharacterized protein LOC143239455 isoform X2 n=1 Tax=Tachypleus tridentatus TaxID=6853 RepID=UPI003FD51F4B